MIPDFQKLRYSKISANPMQSLAKFENKWGLNILWRDRNETDLEKKNERKDDD